MSSPTLRDITTAPWLCSPPVSTSKEPVYYVFREGSHYQKYSITLVISSFPLAILATVPKHGDIKGCQYFTKMRVSLFLSLNLFLSSLTDSTGIQQSGDLNVFRGRTFRKLGFPREKKSGY